MDVNASYIAASAWRGATTSAGNTLHVVAAYVETPYSTGELLRLLKSAFADQTAKLMTPMPMTDLFELYCRCQPIKTTRSIPFCLTSRWRLCYYWRRLGMGVASWTTGVVLLMAVCGQS